MKFRYATLAASAVALAFSAAAQAAPTLQLGLVYVGSTSATLTTVQATRGQGLLPNSNLSIQNLSDPSVQTTAWKHFFDITVHMVPDPSSTEALRGATINISTSAGAAGVALNGTTGGLTQKYFGFSWADDVTGNTVFSPTANNGDGGTAGDLQGIVILDTDAATAFGTAAGVGGGADTVSSTGAGNPASLTLPANTPIGIFGIQLLAASVNGNPVTIAAGPAAGQAFAFFTDTGGTNSTSSTGTTGGTFLIPGIVATPEPASLGMLALGGLALFARRRRTA